VHVAVLYLAITVALAAPSATLAVDAATRARIDALAGPLIEQNVAVGFVIGVLDHGEMAFLSYGEAARGTGSAPDADTVWEIGSITKAFTGLLLADAVVRGEAGLDDPVQRYLPQDVSLPAGTAPITLAQLATHTSGLPRLPPNLRITDMANPYADYTVELLHASLPQLPTQRAAGAYAYSNYGMGLLGHLLARRAGRDYEQLVRERVLQPLGMRDTSITLGEDQRRRLATPYRAGLEPAQLWDLPALAGAGALRSTARDMLRFAAAALGTDPSAPLAEAFALSMRQRQQIEGGLGIALGWHLAGDGTTRWHDGGTGGFRSWLAVLPDRDLAVVVLANSADERIGRFAENVTRAAAGIEMAPQPVLTETALDPTLLQSYVGTYALAPDFALVVTLDSGQLFVQATGQEKFPVYASAPGEFFYKVVDAQLTFVAGPDGRVDKVVLHQGGQDIEGARKR
jgi:serine-type D-Ala-D-Ala carboxypeptidase/endopeptidase